MNKLITRFFSLLIALLLTASLSAAPSSKPNIIYILADDLGYGDVKCLNPQGKIATPHLNSLAAQGMIFTDAHSSSAVCTPTRYGILTGRYNWRTRLQSGVLGGFSAPLIAEDRLTVAAMLKQQGYATACVGKWHLGMNWPLKDNGNADDQGNFGGAYKDAWKIDYTKPITRGPNDVGFDYYFGISASLDMPPYMFIEDRKAVKVPTVTKALWAGRSGPAVEDFKLNEVLPAFTAKAVGFIEKQAAAAKEGKPFFLYMPLNSPHTPIAPSDKWKGKSGISEYCDFVMETDDAVGQVIAAVDKAGLTHNTLIIFTSDNGCSPQANFAELAKHNHDPSGEFRGHKADIFEGGHRVPFIVRWPVTIKAGSTSAQTVCLTDFMATAAAILNVKLPDNAGEDSVSLLPAFTGSADKPLREATVHHSINGSFSIRQGQWKLTLCAGSGGWSDPKPGSKGENDLPAIQLYDLSSDIGETKNVQADHPQVVAKLRALLESYVEQGRSTPGATQKNDANIKLIKGK